MMTFKLVAFFFISVIVSPCEGNAFLRKYDVVGMASGLSEADLERSLLEEIRGYIGNGVQSTHIREVQQALEPMWPALPKNGHERVDSDMARYALHRFFVQKHGWHIRGLKKDAEGADAGSAGNESSVSGSSVLKDKVPNFLLGLFKKALNGRGFRLDNLAVLASTIEHLIYNEGKDRLLGAFQGLALPTTEGLSEQQATIALQAYTASLIGGSAIPHLGSLNAGQVGRLIVKFGRVYPAWNDTRDWLSDMQQTSVFLDKDRSNPFTSRATLFDDVQKMSERVSEKFGSFQNTECKHLKDTLLESEQGTSGRVLLSDFYKKALESTNSWYFSEPIEYLRENGALDETKPGEARVIVANYMGASGNCLGDNGFYSICCINECEGLLGKIEEAVVSSRVAPGRLAGVLANISSDTVEAPRELSEGLLRRLREVAKNHGGEVPLHSRSFGQWLHLAFPRECPNHVPAHKELVKKSEKQEGSVGLQSRESIREYVDSTAAQTEQDKVAAEWIEQEEADMANLLWDIPAEGPTDGAVSMLSSLGRAMMITVAGLLVVAEVSKRIGVLDWKFQADEPAEKPHFV